MVDEVRNGMHPVHNEKQLLANDAFQQTNDNLTPVAKQRLKERADRTEALWDRVFAKEAEEMRDLSFLKDAAPIPRQVRPKKSYLPKKPIPPQLASVIQRYKDAGYA